MRRIFLDTGYLIALEASDDQNHRSAQIYWQELTRRLPLLVTTSYVFDEVVTFFNSRGHHSKAVDIGERLLDSPSVRLVHVDEGLFRAAWCAGLYWFSGNMTLVRYGQRTGAIREIRDPEGERTPITQSILARGQAARQATPSRPPT